MKDNSWRTFPVRRSILMSRLALPIVVIRDRAAMADVMLPPETVCYTAESILSRESGRSLAIYKIIVLSVVATFVSLPVITVTLSAQSAGTISLHKDERS